MTITPLDLQILSILCCDPDDSTFASLRAHLPFVTARTLRQRLTRLFDAAYIESTPRNTLRITDDARRQLTRHAGEDQ